MLDFVSIYTFIFFSMSITPDMVEKIEPMNDRILLAPVNPESTTTSGIIIPDSPNKERPSLYTVISVGPGKVDKDGQLIQIDLKKWDRVITGMYAGDDVKVDDITYKIVAYDYILAKVN